MESFRQADGYVITAEGTFGRGTGSANEDLSLVEVEFLPDTPFFSPYNVIRITRRMLPEGGSFEETVELLKRTEEGSEPFMKILEEGTVYVPASQR